jgi:hypothetical protein
MATDGVPQDTVGESVALSRRNQLADMTIAERCRTG